MQHESTQLLERKLRELLKVGCVQICVNCLNPAERKGSSENPTRDNRPAQPKKAQI